MQTENTQNDRSNGSKAKNSAKMANDQAKSSKPKRENKGMKIPRHFTKPNVHPFDEIKWDRRASLISNPDGSVVFQMDQLEVPQFWSQLATDIAVSKYFRKAGVPQSGHETSVKQLITRVARTIRTSGEQLGGYFHTKEDADTFEMELTHLLTHQQLAFNSPVWFNCGLFHEYGIEGTGGNFRVEPQTHSVLETKNAYEFPQCSACFIQSVGDDLMAIFDLVKNEARIFKYGSGTGTNFSKVRGSMEMLSGGGLSSGLMSFLEVLDRGAGATKSGGTTRRAAKMVVLDIDHPEIEDFVTWKLREERKVAALIAAGYPSDFNGEAYRTVAGQNSNNSVRVNDKFMKAVEDNGEWTTTFRTTGQAYKTYKARDLWKKIADASWACADPGLQFDSTINDWHTCAATDRINGSNPCSEYMFLDDTACNLASINLMKFLKKDGTFDVDGYRHAAAISTIGQEILVAMSSYPTAKIAQNSYDYRPLGLGYANLGTLLMVKGIPYDSDQGRAWAAALTAIMCGQSYKTSAEMAKSTGPFPEYKKNENSMLRVIRKHRSAVEDISPKHVPEYLVSAARNDWDDALTLGTKYGYRNAQATVLAPTGTIGLLMDCDTTGVEPDFSLVKFKKLAGGGYFKIVNQSIPAALKNLGYKEAEAGAIIEFAIGTMHMKGTPHINEKVLLEKGFSPEDIAAIEKNLHSAFELSQVFRKGLVSTETLERMGFTAEQYNNPHFQMLTALGFTYEQIREANAVICGRMTVEGAPHLKPEHLAVFDCANKCGNGSRFIAPMGHVRMMGAVQPFLSGAISKTVNLPHEATAEDIENIHLESWRLGLKAIAVYRDGCKLSQPLSSKGSSKKEEKPAEKATLTMPSVAVPTAAAQAIANQLTPQRRRLPKKRDGFTIEAKVAGHKVYLRTGNYEDGRLGEIFIDMHKEGATFRSLLNCFAISVSLGLQYGVPLEEFVDVFTFTRFEPQGMVDHPNIKSATSVIDFIFRVVGMEYLNRTDFVHVKPEQLSTTAAPAPMAAEPQSPAATTNPDAENQIDLFGTENDHRDGNKKAAGESAVTKLLSSMMGDAPFCNSCGHTTVRNGACYRCLNCGNSMGCS